MVSGSPLPAASHSTRFPRIFRLLAGATTSGLLACAPAAATAGKVPVPSTGDPTRTYSLGQVYLLKMSEPPVADTSVRVRRGVPRAILLRHAAPDDLTFAELLLPAAAFDSSTTDSVDVSIHVHQGEYGLDLTTSAPLKSATLTFKYAVHFAAPEDARKAFGSAVAFERKLAIGKLGPGATIVFQRSQRPAADNLSTTIVSAGSYVVGAPK